MVKLSSSYTFPFCAHIPLLGIRIKFFLSIVWFADLHNKPELKSNASQVALALIKLKQASPVSPVAASSPPAMFIPVYACQPDGSTD